MIITEKYHKIIYKKWKKLAALYNLPVLLLDPYAVVSFIGNTQQTEKQIKTTCPTWDQTLLFDDLIINGSPVILSEENQAPSVVVEIFDWDARVLLQ